MPGKEPELVRTTIGGNGTTFDLLGRLIVCEGDDRRLTRMGLDGKVESLVDNYKGRPKGCPPPPGPVSRARDRDGACPDR